ncbi:alpha-L RNA-binding motif-containing protein [Heliocybe sulcata]|uniref:Alpha-L RNA-binding motif-containing protein n=1 Tax=Heliocybe sulcata TaxID=5364 RepID=A0A5C3MPP3_9AGAM|nr:alpha-L RNA-binding motif-containing protein [Heliocybe sulcata]
MKELNIYSVRRGLPRMSWHPRNLYNLWRRTFGNLRRETNFKTTSERMYRQRWTSKKLVRAYHGDHINEKIFKRWYLPKTLPDVRPQKRVVGDDSIELSSWAGRTRTARKEQERLREEAAKGLAPVGSLMLSEVERRIDVFLFRCCFAHSVYEARRLVVHGEVLLNGKKHANANTRLAPGDLVSVNPKAIRFLQPLPQSEQAADVKASPEAESESHAESSEDAKSDETAEPTDTTSATTAEGEPAAAETSEAAQEQAAPAAEEDKKPDNEEAPRAAPNTRRTTGSPNSILRALQKNPNLTPFNLPQYASPWLFIPAYIEVSFATCSAIYLRHPTARPGYSEIPTPYEADGEVIRLAWEWYSRVRPRIRSKSQLARTPENRTSKGASLIL